MKGFFIAGTNTDVGKTWVGCRIVEHLIQQGVRVYPKKPVESGCQNVNNQLVAVDALQYEAATNEQISHSAITPHRFQSVCSPALAAKREQKKLDFSMLQTSVEENLSENDFVICEGAGGLFSPLAENKLNIDLVESTNLPVILVSDDRLGSISTILLSLEALNNRSIEVKAIILNKLSDEFIYDSDNFNELKNYTSIPLIRCKRDDKDFTRLLFKEIGH